MHITITDRPMRNGVSNRQMRSKIPEHFQLISNKKTARQNRKSGNGSLHYGNRFLSIAEISQTKDSAGNNTANRSSIAPVSKRQLESAIGASQLCPTYPDSATSTIATRPAATAACASSSAPRNRPGSSTRSPCPPKGRANSA